MDLNTYRSSLSFFGNELSGVRPLYFGNKSFKWSYGTYFNTSTIGVELYLFNYLKIKDFFASLYLRYGFPFKNNGFGFCIPKIFVYRNFSLGFSTDLWTQYYYRKGFSVNSNIV